MQAVDHRPGILARMTTVAKQASLPNRLILGFATGSLVLILALCSWIYIDGRKQQAVVDRYQEALLSHQQEQIDKLTDLVAMQSASLAVLQEMVMTNRRELDRGGH